jgi:HD-GYP domain-containing protein (c-di-GMP phosphodiesterase class II)
MEAVAAAGLATPGNAPVAVDDALVHRVRASERRSLDAQGRVLAVVLALSLVGAGVATELAFTGGRAFAPATWILFAVVYALAARVHFEVGSIVALPVQLVLVPMLFALRPGDVPFCVAAGLVLSWLPEFVRGTTSLDRVPLRIANAWHAVGPAIVLGVAGTHEIAWSRWPVYVAALAAQFAADFTCTGLWSKHVHAVSFRAHAREAILPFGVDAALAPMGLLLAFPVARHPLAVLLVLPLVGLLGYFARERQVRIDHALELSHAYRGTALLLGDVIEADDAYTGSHSRAVVELTIAVADRLKLDAAGRHDAEFVALLHDVGKVRIPAEIINKPEPLDPEERAIINTHTLEGERMLEQIGGLLGRVGRIVRSCHERWDGAGYPDGLAGEQIPLVARIVCCCDAFNAMTTDRPYRCALSVEDAKDELRRNRGTQFDPLVVDALLAVVG